jgi:hypothetical protein
VTLHRHTEDSDITGISSAGEKKEEDEEEDEEDEEEEAEEEEVLDFFVEFNCLFEEEEETEEEEKEEDEDGLDPIAVDLGNTNTRQDPSPHTTASIPKKFKDRSYNSLSPLSTAESPKGSPKGVQGLHATFQHGPLDSIPIQYDNDIFIFE